MASESLEEKRLEFLLKAVPHLLKLGKRCMRLEYDAQADVFYFHFEKKPASTHSEMREDGVLLDYQDDRLVGLTILDASRR